MKKLIRMVILILVMMLGVSYAASTKGNATGKNCSKCSQYSTNHIVYKKIYYRYHDIDHWESCDNCGTIKGTGKKHTFDVNNRACKVNCGYTCPDKLIYVYKDRSGNVSEKDCLVYCSIKEHDHGKLEHRDGRGNGVCQRCSYPCINGHSYNNGKCTKCGKQTKTSQKPNNGCTQCGSQIISKWEPDGVGNHYKLCTKGHKNSQGAHVDQDENLECDICYLTITTCYSCKAVLKNGWYTAANDNENHYKVCDAGHASYKKIHNDSNSDGVCDDCNAQMPCTTCKSLLKSDLEVDLDKGVHYKACINGHRNYEEAHIDKDENVVCDICWHDISTCYVCNSRLKIGWFEADSMHYKECTSGHPSYIKTHIDVDSNNVCDTCGYDISIASIGQGNMCQCGGEIIDEWLGEGTPNHYKLCTNGHKYDDFMHYDVDFDKSCDICSLSITTCYICQKSLNEKWDFDEKGNHYFTCVDGHPSYIALHEDGDYDLLCDYCGAIIKNCYVCNGELLEEWRTDKEGYHYKRCINGDDSYILPHTSSDDEICTVCGYQLEEVDYVCGFKDVPVDLWSAEAIKFVVDEGIMTGMEEDKFNPTGDITREMFATIISRVAKNDKFEIKEKNKIYSDSEIHSEWACEAIKKYGEYIVEDENFGPKDKVTRADVAKTFVKVFDLENKVEITEETYDEIELIKQNESLDSELERAVGIMLQTGIFKGNNNRINISDLVSRQELAMMLYIIYDLDFGKEDELSCPTCGLEAYYEKTESIHLLVCTNNASHIKLEDHKIKNGVCSECKYKETKTYISKFADFTDESHWAWRNVCNLAEKGIIKGAMDSTTGELKLYPDEKITAEAFIALASRILGYDGIDELKNEKLYMPIISAWSEGEWRYLIKYLGSEAETVINTALATNLVPEDEKEIATNYKKYITREKAAYLLGCLFNASAYTQFGKFGIDYTDKYEDWGEVSGAYQMRLALLTFFDILRGNLESEKFYVSPKEKITRVQAIALIDRYKTVKDIFNY